MICLLIAKAFCSSVFLLSCLLIGKENLKIWKCLSDWLKRTAMFCLERKKGKFDQSENRTVFKAPMTKQKEKREQHYKIDSLTFTYYYSYAETKWALINTRAESPWSEPYFGRFSALPNKAFPLWKLFFKKWRFKFRGKKTETYFK